MMQDYITVLTIAGSDGSSGAGIQADLKTIAFNNCYGLSVITAVTAQNTLEVQSIHNIPPAFISEQFKTIVDDIRIDAVKIGMLGSPEAGETVVELIKSLDEVPVVLDTVLRSSSGKSLFEAATMQVMKRLFRIASLITPNLPEAALLTGRSKPPTTPAEIEVMAKDLQREGAKSVLVKGGHGEGDQCSDCLLHEGRFFWYANPKIDTLNTHGTGCTLSSAIACGLAKGLPMNEAVADAIGYTRKALQAGASWQLGHGNGPLEHFPGRRTECRPGKKQ
ncbi:bifunctional hydroxymethylpyrimidine kinase/phosphomethylpyrimidine kinase [Chlorobaculum sp. MV4-Y]|uniref:bifunctional hydroxymethylpyrimidine kinase/phosphomethylpyrimidine kinase n=1 Tax=Chlorobaculum sp. MV4-Y TaxID=2976335 RepID=UPI0021AFB203|nr:bifunctional hydroxymethylpyrimidine kinase/phosphomethylpyrimidine kinase [Chlorobaculum sp. MV4-Y]UWX58617.1 bifunctional hydroxymethylpyrimidine kinase/phosphomethylpyrimidine kinase [Chlorobaculum sp. MV4-Y]